MLLEIRNNLEEENTLISNLSRGWKFFYSLQFQKSIQNSIIISKSKVFALVQYFVNYSQSQMLIFFPIENDESEFSSRKNDWIGVCTKRNNSLLKGNNLLKICLKEIILYCN